MKPAISLAHSVVNIIEANLKLTCSWIPLLSVCLTLTGESRFLCSTVLEVTSWNVHLAHFCHCFSLLVSSSLWRYF